MDVLSFFPLTVLYIFVAVVTSQLVIVGAVMVKMGITKQQMTFYLPTLKQFSSLVLWETLLVFKRISLHYSPNVPKDCTHGIL